MTDRADEGIPQFVTFQPLRPRIAVAVAFLIVLTLVFVSLPDGPWHLTIAPFYVVGSLTYWMVVNRTVVIRLEEQAVDIRLGWRRTRISYERITEVAAGPRTAGWQTGRRLMDDGSTGYLLGGSSVRIITMEEAVVVSVEDPHSVVGAIQRRLKGVA
ncbi:hypothetical protein [Kocuria sabuli]|uniref:hypothetical protein n=1 Tax=Kocuria sabuli TaxID=3071448 RepID=UPI0034D6F803